MCQRGDVKVQTRVQQHKPNPYTIHCTKQNCPPGLNLKGGVGKGCAGHIGQYNFDKKTKYIYCKSVPPFLEWGGVVISVPCNTPKE